MSPSFQDFLLAQTAKLDEEIIKSMLPDDAWIAAIKPKRRPVDPLRAAIRKARREYAKLKRR